MERTNITQLYQGGSGQWAVLLFMLVSKAL